MPRRDQASALSLCQNETTPWRRQPTPTGFHRAAAARHARVDLARYPVLRFSRAGGALIPLQMKSRVSIRSLLFLFVGFVSHAGFGDAIGAPAEPLLFTQAPVTGSVAESPPASSLDGISDAQQAPPSSRIQQIPAKAHAVLKAIQDRDGEPPSGYVGGRTFQNRERRLPRGHYREYDVNPKRPGKNRGSERIVIERRTGKAYYTGDHYRTFVPMN